MSDDKCWEMSDGVMIIFRKIHGVQHPAIQAVTTAMDDEKKTN